MYTVDPLDWEISLRRWVKARRNISSELEDKIITFFKVAFEHTRCPERAWFGIHSSTVSLVVGGIFLAAIQSSGAEPGIWLLVDAEKFLNISGVEYLKVKSTQRSKHPLIWAHSLSLTTLPNLLTNTSLWESFSAATEKILFAPIAKDRDSVQEKRNKKRLSEFRLPQSSQIFERQFQETVHSAFIDKPEVRRRRLETAPIYPNKTKVVTLAFVRNRDVVAEVLIRANGYCEHCKNSAPFIRRSNGLPYLEVHHIKTLAEGGEDTVSNAVALCPNCHRKVHYA